ncbi:MAG: hypothetical protein WDZ41_05940 [Candidatus Babeliales bacterium]
MKLRPPILLVGLYFLSFNLFSQQTPPDLQKYFSDLQELYKKNKSAVTDVTDRVDALQKKIDALPQQGQTVLQKDIDPVAKKVQGAVSQSIEKIDLLYKNFLNRMNTVVQQYRQKNYSLNQAMAQLSPLINQARQQMINSVRSTYQIVGSIAQIESQYNQIQRQVASKQAQEKETAQIVMQQKIQKMLQGISKIIPTLEKTNDAARQTIITFLQTGNLDRAKVNTITRQYETILSSLYATYSSIDFPINFDDKNNYITAVMQQLINFFLDDVSATINKAQRLYQELSKQKKDKHPYYNYFFALAQRLTGMQKGSSVLAQGYDAIIEQQAKKLFGDDAHKVTTYYEQKKLSMSIDAFGNALLDLSITVVDPNEQDLVIGYAIYKELMAHTQLLQDKAAQQLITKVNTYMAVLYTNRAQSILKNLKVDKDNSDAVALVIDAYKKANQYYKIAGNESNAQEFNNFAQQLQEGQQSYAQAQAAEKQQNITAAINLYQKAYESFVRGGDAVDAQQVSSKKNQLQADYNIKEGAAYLSAFLKNYNALFKSYMAYISSVDDDKEALNYKDILDEFTQAIEKATQAYQKAKPYFKAVGKNTTFLDNSISVLENINKAFEQVLNADRLATLATTNGLNQAKSIYAQSLQFAKNADDIFNKALSSYVLIYPSLIADQALNNTLTKDQVWTIQTLINRHIARIYIKVASALKAEPLVALQYYIQASGGRTRYLSEQMNAFLAEQLQAISETKENVMALYEAAQTQEKNVLQLTQDAWQSKDNNGYTSEANDIWQDVLQKYLTAWQFGKAEARGDYLRVISEYAEQYKQNVSELYYPNIGTALIYYRQYVIYVKDKEDEKRNAIFKKIKNLSQPFFNTIQALVKKITITQDIETLKSDTKNITRWFERFDQVLNTQQSIITALAPQQDQKQFILFEKNIDNASGNITYQLKPMNNKAELSITISYPDAMFAEAFKKLADSLFDKNNYEQAYPIYYQAESYYQKIDNPLKADEVKNKGDLAYTRSLINSYQKLVIPHKEDMHGIKEVNVAGLSVPERYEIYNFIQPLPDYFPLPINLQNLAKNPTKEGLKQAEETLKVYAYLLYVGNILKDKGIAFFNVFTPELQLRSAPNVSQEQLSVVTDILAQANTFREMLNQRIQQQKSSIHLQLRQSPMGDTYLLSILYQPTFAVPPLNQTPMSELPYRGYPMAYTYYFWTQKLADPSVKNIQYGQQLLVSGGQQDIYQEMNDKLGNAYLSAAYLAKKRVDFLLNGGNVNTIDPMMNVEELNQLEKARKDIVAIKKINKENMHVKLADFIDSYAIIKGYIKDVIITYYQLGANFYKKNNNVLEKVNQLLSENYILLGDTAQLFLIGNPQAFEYFAGARGSWSGVLAELMNFYQLARALEPDRVDELQLKIAQPFINAGDLLIKQGNNFGSLRYYKIAIAAIKAMKNINPQKLSEISIKFLRAAFEGSTDNMMQYRQALLAPLKIDQQEITLEQLVGKIQICPSPLASPAECEKFEQLRTTLLDALIYYQDCSAWANIFRETKNGQADYSEQTKKAAELVDAYMKQNNLSFETFDEVKKVIIRSDFKTIINGGFEQFSKKITAASSTERMIGYLAIQKWANTLFLSFGKIYIEYYLSGVSPEGRFAEFFKAISAERGSINAPAEEWLGEQ